MDAHTHVCPNCGKSQSFPFGEPLFCEKCGHSVISKDPSDRSNPSDLSDLPIPTGARDSSLPYKGKQKTQINGCLLIWIFIFGFVAFVVLMATIIPESPQMTPEERDQQYYHQKAQDDLQRQNYKEMQEFKEAIERDRIRRGY